MTDQQPRRGTPVVTSEAGTGNGRVKPDADQAIAPGRRRSPVRALLLSIIGLIAVSGVSLWAGTQIKSPEQAAADAAPPAPSTITAVVEERVLTQQLIVRGTSVADGVDMIVRPTD